MTTMETITKTPKKNYSERSKVRKQLRDSILTCCQNAWQIPTDNMKRVILTHMGVEESEIEYTLLACLRGGMTPEQITKEKEVALNTLLTSQFYFSNCVEMGYFDEYEDLVYQIHYEFNNF